MKKLNEGMRGVELVELYGASDAYLFIYSRWKELFFFKLWTNIYEKFAMYQVLFWELGIE